MGIDITALQRLADPAAAASAAAAGLPTIDLNAFKGAVTAHLETKKQDTLRNMTSMVGNILADSDKMVESAMKAMGDIKAPAIPGGAIVGNAMASATKLASKGMALTGHQNVIEELKKAKDHALATGNFIPLLALTQPKLSLKSLPKGLVTVPALPTIPEIPAIPGITG